MASNVHRNGVAQAQRGSTKLDRPNHLRTASLKPRQVGSALRRSSPGSLAARNGDGVPGRVRVAVRLRPRNTEEMMADADFADCVELQPELKRLKLRRNNWDSDTFEFDEVLTEFSSQKRVYEVVAKPVVESVLDGYNGTVMAYGQTGTGKTFTLGRLGEEDTSDRGIMVRSMEDILADLSPETDSVTVSYLQLYMETLQDLLNPANDNIPIVEDPRTGDVSLPGATLIEIRDQQSFLELLRIGEAHRVAANTKLNTESSRSHAILTVHVKRSVVESEDIVSTENNDTSHLTKPAKPLLRKSKLVVVDLAGSERVHKSGSEGHMLEEAKCINLSLSALGKCINALAENSAHVPFRDSKLTRLLRDSFGGTARTSLIVTIGPSPRHRGETSSTILFGQRAMKVENMLKIKEEFDYKSLSRKLEVQLDKLIAENERQQKAYEDEVERINLEAQCRIAEVERNFADALERERLKCQMEYMESVKQLEQKLVSSQERHGCNYFEDGCGEGPTLSSADEIAEVKKLFENESDRRKAAEAEVEYLKSQLGRNTQAEAGGDAEIIKLRSILEDEANQKKKLEEEIIILRSQLLQLNFEADQMRRCLESESSVNAFPAVDSSMSQVRHSQLKEAGNGQKSSVAALFEQVGLQKILSLLESDDANVRIHAVKVVANLAAEEENQKSIVEAGGLSSLLMLLRRYEDETVRRVAAGAIANLAMNEANQELIMAEGGITLLSMTASDAEEPQTLRMVAGAIANLCGNDKILMKLRSQGGIKALLGIVRCGHPDVLSQVARGIANYAKCESRASNEGIKSGKSFLIEDGALPWMVQNANNEAAPIRRHIELALCHLARHEVNAKDMISGGALWELVRISRDCTREDIRNLARRTLSSIPTFKSELRRLRIDY
ncbi:kinesin-like protein KIN-UB isoform X1 [Gastrolobium bilobum]|uniref:kinesin-like protein KIN-UB isoform X1 n=1 Tax=Gastrolobium bilobum TaxID=150636 RepID=UPI002AB06B37|nr:kinesin-like protein KIN-UB isoform X1 [Gastrolobium bilobum]